jgi:hypothetical protein
METSAVHHLVTIRLEDHVEQLEQTHQALLGVRAHLAQIQRSLERVSQHSVVQSSVPEELRIALHRLRITSDSVDAVLRTIQPPDCGPIAGFAGLN